MNFPFTQIDIILIAMKTCVHKFNKTINIDTQAAYRFPIKYSFQIELTYIFHSVPYIPLHE